MVPRHRFEISIFPLLSENETEVLKMRHILEDDLI